MKYVNTNEHFGAIGTECIFDSWEEVEECADEMMEIWLLNSDSDPETLRAEFLSSIVTLDEYNEME